MKLGAVGLAVGLAALLIAAVSLTARGNNAVTTVTTSTTPQQPQALTTESTVTAVTTTEVQAPAPAASTRPAARPAVHRASPCRNNDSSDPTGDDNSGCGSGGDGDNGPDDQAGDGKSGGS